MMSIVTSMKACKQFHFGSVIWIFVAIFGTYYVSVRYTNIKYAKRLVEHQMKEQAQNLQVNTSTFFVREQLIMN